VSLLTQLFGPLDAASRASEPQRQTESASVALAAANGASVLLVEDNDINALLARAVLEKSGAQVVRVRNGGEAVDQAREALAQTGKGFDLVLMDIHMPDMDGVEAARRIKALYPENARAAEGRPPIVALTANAFVEDRAAYLEAGLDDYLAKPFEKGDLAALLTRWRRRTVESEGQAGLGAA
jgi:CheY-like chemotaxis protein